MQVVFSRVHPVCSSIVGGIGREVALKGLIRILWIAQGLCVGA